MECQTGRTGRRGLLNGAPKVTFSKEGPVAFQPLIEYCSSVAWKLSIGCARGLPAVIRGEQSLPDEAVVETEINLYFQPLEPSNSGKQDHTAQPQNNRILLQEC